MSTLTKVFIVLLVVFSIAFTSMTVAVVVQTANWRETALKYQEHARIADTNLRHAHAACAAQKVAAEDEIRSHLRRISDVQSELDAARREVVQFRTDLAKVSAEKNSAEAMNRGLVAQLQLAEQARNEFRTQRDELENRSVELQRRNIDLSDRVNELTATVDVLTEQRRQYEQQINILTEQNEKLIQGSVTPTSAVTFEAPQGAALPGVEALSPVSMRKIQGRVLEVADDLVTLSVGSADGVKKNMVFVLHREAEYVADVQIVMVEPDQAAARVVRSVRSPAVDDLATDALSLSRARR